MLGSQRTQLAPVVVVAEGEIDFHRMQFELEVPHALQRAMPENSTGGAQASAFLRLRAVERPDELRQTSRDSKVEGSG